MTQMLKRTQVKTYVDAWDKILLWMVFKQLHVSYNHQSYR
jgi:hypothetical protein